MRSNQSSDTDDEERFSEDARKLHRYIRKLKWSKVHAIISMLRSQADDAAIRTALTQCNRHGESPLHAITKDAPESLMLLLLQLIPSAERKDYLLVFDNQGNTPLHCLCQHVVSVADARVVIVVANLCPQAMGLRNHAGDTPLHLFVKSRGYMESDNVPFVEQARWRLQHGSGPLGVYGMSTSCSNKRRLCEGPPLLFPQISK